MKLLHSALPVLCVLVTSSAPAAVVIESPANGSTVTSPVQLDASVGSFQRANMLVYVNKTLVLQLKNVGTIQSSLTLNPGANVITVVAQNRRSTSSATSNVTVASASGTPSGSPAPSVATQIADDMTGSNEGYPHGVPSSWDFYSGPTMSDGNNPPAGWNAATAWGAIYVDSTVTGNPAPNTRVNIRNVQLWFLSKSTGQWSQLQLSSQPDGAWYYEDFANDFSEPADVRTESDGTMSVTAGNGFCYHFYPTDRGQFNPNDVGGWVALFEARLILADPTQPDDRANARYLGATGADYWQTITSGMPAGSTVEPAIASGKFKYVQNSWRSFAMTTISATQLANDPPPINFTGVLP